MEKFDVEICDYAFMVFCPAVVFHDSSSWSSITNLVSFGIIVSLSMAWSRARQHAVRGKVTARWRDAVIRECFVPSRSVVCRAVPLLSWHENVSMDLFPAVR